MPRRFIALTFCTIFFAVAPSSPSMVVQASSGDNSFETTDSTTYVYDLQEDPAQCINSNPRPNCGKAPEQPGDRGGWLQYTVFGIMIAGLSFIGFKMFRGVARRDRAIAESLKEPQQ
ncbi:MAG: hypothetical protein EXQ63_07425 [Ilumatobacteraceae bacterium]|nr:hypothetical protein [Ilumatobacteraceae bacterium]